MKTIVVIAIIASLMIGAPSAFAHAPLSKHPISDMLYGYDHGVADAKDLCKPECHIYIWHSPNGFINQTKEFIDRYVLFCSIAGPDASMDERGADFWCSAGPSSAGWMVGQTITGNYTSKFGPAN